MSFLYTLNRINFANILQLDIRKLSQNLITYNRDASRLEYVYNKLETFIDGLVSLFNGISTFVGYLMPMLFS